MTLPSGARAPALALLLACGAFLLYARTAGFAFVEYDDPGYVRDNPHIAHGLTGASVRWAFTSTSYQYNWHPLTWLSHALDVEWSGLDAGGHHRVNALLHALNAALVFLAFRALTGATWASALAAALFALHPLRVESVAWVSERKDVLAGTFFALTLLAYARGKLGWVALALSGGLMAKPTLVTVPFVLLLLDFWPLRRTETRSLAALVREKLPLFALALASVVLTLVAQQRGGAIQADAPLSARLLQAPIAYVTYLAQYLWPSGLAVFYPHPALVEPERTRLATAGGAFLLLALASLLAFRARHRRPWILVGWCWFLGMLVPMIGLVQVGTLAHADRYVYLAVLGLELALALSVRELVRARPAFRPAVVALALLWLAALGFRAMRQVDTWRDSRTLFAHALAVTGENFVAHNNLGLTLAHDGEIDEALGHFESAARIWPGFFEAQLNVGLARYGRAELSEAQDALERALALRPGHGEARLCLAATLARAGDLGRAEVELDRALADEPALADDPRAASLRQGLERRPR